MYRPVLNDGVTTDTSGVGGRGFKSRFPAGACVAPRSALRRRCALLRRGARPARARSRDDRLRASARPPLGSWDALRGFADSDERVSTRRAEEEAVLPATPHGLTFLPLLERQYAEQGGRQDFTAV